MKRFLVIFFVFMLSNLIAQSSAPVTPTTEAKEVKTPAKVEAKATDEKTPAKETKTTGTKPTTKTETTVVKEIPPLQKEGGFYVLKGVKWQAENVTKKTYISGKTACEKDGMRLPTRDELIDAYTSKYPEFRNPTGSYVSSTRRISDRSTVWFVSFENGHHNAGSLFREFNIRCIKDEPKPQPAKTETSSESKTSDETKTTVEPKK